MSIWSAEMRGDLDLVVIRSSTGWDEGRRRLPKLASDAVLEQQLMQAATARLPVSSRRFLA